MTILDFASIVLATWCLTYQITFGQWLEGIRRWIGIGFDLDDAGNEIERFAANSVAAIINCYSCTAVLVAPVVYLIWWLGLEALVDILAVMGMVQIVGRWHLSQRIKREWWL